MRKLLLLSIPLAVLAALVLFSMALAEIDCVTRITIIEDAEPPNGQNFGFNGIRSGGGWSQTFTLDDLNTVFFPIDIDAPADGSIFFPNVLNNKWYTVTQTANPGDWQLKNISCSVTNSSGTPKSDVTIYTSIAPDHKSGQVWFYLLDYRYVTCTFFNVLPMDYGDLPETTPNYGATTLANNGARHYIMENSVYLGSLNDVEIDGQPNTSANGDDTLGGSDEDGVAPLAPSWSGGSGKVGVTVSGPVGSAGCLMGWLDFYNAGAGDPFDPDGIFTPSFSYGGSDYSEIIVNNMYVGPGAHEFTFPLPPGAANNALWYARFRLVPYNPASGFTMQTIEQTGQCNQAPADLKGLAVGGEVEDYLWPFGATAVTLQSFSAKAPSMDTSVLILVLGLAVLTVLWSVLRRAHG